MAAIASVFSLFGHTQARAADGESAERREFVEPAITEETLPNEPGERDVRLIVRYDRHGSGGTALLPWCQFFFGITPRLGGDIGAGMILRDAPDRGYGFGPVSASLKYVVVPKGVRAPAIVLGVEGGFPTGKSEDGEKAYAGTLFLALLEDFGPVVVQGSVGYSTEIPTSDEAITHAIEYSWAASLPVGSGRAQLLAEIFGEIGKDGVRDPVTLAPGIRFRGSKRWSVAVAATVGLTEGAADWGMVGQIQWSF